MSTIVEVTESFFEELTTFATSKSLPVSWPDVKFDPPDSGNWLEVVVLYDPTENYSLANDDASISKGTFRVAACSKPKRGVIDILDIARQVALTFKKGHVFSGTTARVVSEPSVSSPLIFDDRTMVYASIRWFDTLSLEHV